MINSAIKVGAKMQYHFVLFVIAAIVAAKGLYQMFIKKVPISSTLYCAWGSLLFWAYIFK